MKINCQKYQLFQEVSAGGVVYKKEGKMLKIAIIERAAMGDRTLPKGHQDQGESLQETALREVKEETGFHAKPIDYLGKFTYSVRNEEKKKISTRTVHWFLMEYKGGAKISGNEEVKKVTWVPVDFKTSLLSHDNDKMIVHRAIKHLQKQRA
ncbi:MAG: NUDIX hydrolase [Patescibacteria group bacterium]|jgi:8-oxo-dGTP diphosphatase